MKQKKSIFQLTPVEESIMMILWQHDAKTVWEIKAQLSLDQPLAYTSISTILRILAMKGVLHSKKSGRRHLYTPTYDRQQYIQYRLKKLTNQFFSGDRNRLIHYLNNL